MKVYLINLDRSPERLAWFTGQATELGLDVVRIPAIDGKKLGVDELAYWRSLTKVPRFLSAAEIGCLLSHRKAWEAVCAGDERWAFIAEDDIHLSGNAAAFLLDDSWIPEAAVLIKAETYLQLCEFSATTYASPFGHELRRLKSTHWCCGGYFLTREAAEHMLSFTGWRCEVVDALLFSEEYMEMHGLEVLQIIPAICLQNRLFSGMEFISSVIDEERSIIRLEYKSSITISRKIYREFFRIIIQIKSFFIRNYLKLFKKSIFIRVKFHGSNLL